MIDELRNFIAEELDVRNVEARNILAAGSLTEWQRYRHYLAVILARYEKECEEYCALFDEQMRKVKAKADPSGRTEVDADLAAIHERLVEVGLKVHLEIHSFYIFAKILLDRIADTLLLYFDYQWPKPPQGSTHAKLCYSADGIAAAKGWEVVPPDILAKAQDLNERIIRYRNYEIEHLNNPRKMLGFAWSADKKVKASSNLLYPSEEELQEIEKLQKTSENLEVLLKDIEVYGKAILQHFRKNIEKSIVKSPSLGEDVP